MNVTGRCSRTCSSVEYSLVGLRYWLPGDLLGESVCAPGYNPGSSDVLIAKFEDTNGDGSLGAGDRVVRNQYPLDFGPTGFGIFRSTSIVVSSASYNAAFNTLTAFYGDGTGTSPVGTFQFTVAPGLDEFQEFTVNQGGFVLIQDTTGPGGFGIDRIVAFSQSAGQPSTLVEVERLNETDDSFLDVDILF